MIVQNQDGIVTQLSDEVQRKIMSHGGGMMAVEFTFKKGGVGAVHHHPHEQIGYIVEGRFELEMDGRKQIVSAGDTYYVPSNVPHGVVALEDGKIFDAFTPQRDDFLAS